MSQTDYRFPDWKPTDRTTKTALIFHMDYAHEEQARGDGVKWVPNLHYFLRKYSKKKLFEIHEGYHK